VTVKIIIIYHQNDDALPSTVGLKEIISTYDSWFFAKSFQECTY